MTHAKISTISEMIQGLRVLQNEIPTAFVTSKVEETIHDLLKAKSGRAATVRVNNLISLAYNKRGIHCGASELWNALTDWNSGNKLFLPF